MFKLFPAVAACALLASASTSAQTMYRCEQQGRFSYGDRPCTSGVASELKVAPTPAPDPDTVARLARQQALAAQLTQRDLVDELVYQRERRAAVAQKNKCARLRLRQKWAQEDTKVATPKNSAVAQRKARRQAESLALECPS